MNTETTLTDPEKNLVDAMNTKTLPEAKKAIQRVRAERHETFSRCFICKSKLMFYLEFRDPTLEQVMCHIAKSRVQNRQEPIKKLREYTQDIIRATTGYSLYDNFIVEHKLWNVRRPVLATGKALEELEMMQKELYDNGKVIHDLTEAVKKKDSCLVKVVEYIVTIGHTAFFNQLIPLMPDSALKPEYRGEK